MYDTVYGIVFIWGNEMVYLIKFKYTVHDKSSSSSSSVLFTQQKYMT